MKDQTTPTELLALADEMQGRAFVHGGGGIAAEIVGWSKRLRTLATTLSAREDGWPTRDNWAEWMEHAIKVYPDSIPALIATRTAMGPTDVLTSEDIEWAMSHAPKAPTAGEG